MKMDAFTHPIGVTVVTPAFNPAALENLTDCLNAQTFRDFEWIIVDDGSSSEFDDAFEKAVQRSYAPACLSRLHSRQGPARARNVGWAKGHGAYVKFIDADDSIDAGHLEALWKAAGCTGKSRTIAFAPTRHVFVSPGHRAPIARVNGSHLGIPQCPRTQLIRHLKAPFLSHCGALFPMGLIRSLNGYDESLVTDEDGDLLARILIAGYCFQAVEGTCYDYRHTTSTGRVSTNDSPAKIRSRVLVCHRILEQARTAYPELEAALSRASALRLDRIATSAWQLDHEMGAALFARARAICGDYDSELPRWERVLRGAMGLNVGLELSGVLRRLRARMG